jgi:hypothetical protein
VTGSALEAQTNPTLGIYTDFIGPQGGPTPSFALAPPTDDWQQTFDLANSQGVGAFAISPSAPLFATDTGKLTVSYDLFDGDPTAGGNQVASSSVSADFSVQVGADVATPEPATGGAGLAIWILLVARNRRSR